MSLHTTKNRVMTLEGWLDSISIQWSFSLELLAALVPWLLLWCCGWARLCSLQWSLSLTITEKWCCSAMFRVDKFTTTTNSCMSCPDLSPFFYQSGRWCWCMLQFWCSSNGHDLLQSTLHHVLQTLTPEQRQSIIDALSFSTCRKTNFSTQHWGHVPEFSSLDIESLFQEALELPYLDSQKLIWSIRNNNVSIVMLQLTVHQFWNLAFTDEKWNIAERWCTVAGRDMSWVRTKL